MEMQENYGRHTRIDLSFADGLYDFIESSLNDEPCNDGDIIYLSFDNGRVLIEFNVYVRGFFYSDGDGWNEPREDYFHGSLKAYLDSAEWYDEETEDLVAVTDSHDLGQIRKMIQDAVDDYTDTMRY